MSTLFVDTINEKTSGNRVQIPGHIIQAVTTQNITAPAAMSSSSFAATGVKVAITPTSTSSKILVTYTSSMNIQAATAWVDVTLYRDGSTNLAFTDSTNADAFNGCYNQGSTDTHVPCVGIVLDSPATTSEVEYEIYFRSRNNSSQCRFNPDKFTNSMTAIEFSA